MFEYTELNNLPKVKGRTMIGAQKHIQPQKQRQQKQNKQMGPSQITKILNNSEKMKLKI